MKTEFKWIDFYKELANKILSFKNNRDELLSKVFTIFEHTNMNNYFKDGEQNFTDVCPFTIMGMFNRGIKQSNRIAILEEFANIFNINAPVPESFEGIPVLNNMKAWFFGDNNYDRETHINKLWELFEASINLADNNGQDAENHFSQIYDFVITQPCSSWNITFGLFWIRPHRYITLDANTRAYLNTNLGMNFNFNKLPTGNRYLEICTEIKNKLSETDEINTFPSLSRSAWMTNTTAITTPEEIQSIHPNSDTPQYWAFAPGPNASLWDEFHSLGIIGVGWDIGDLKQYQNKEQITKSLAEKYPKKESSFKNVSLALWNFASKMQIGDVVYAKLGTTMLIGRGIITSRYIYDDLRAKYKHIRKIKWTHSGKWTLDSKIAMKTLTDFTPYKEWCIRFEELICGKPVTDQTKYNKDNFLSDVYMESEKYDDITALLDRKKNIILQGAPGVGKSFLARLLAYSVIGIKDVNKLEMVQFHQSYSYEDFIEGFRPVGNGNFDIKKGVFYKFCQKAGDDKANKYFFIIDEINRGNLSKIMGELMLMLESDKRGEEYAMPLTYSGEKFYVPENVYVIGMMNTADRSLAMIDYALRRRFSFIQIEPAFDNERFIADFRKNYSDADTVIIKIKELNKLIAEELDSGHQIGHSYFCFNKPVDKKVISGIFKFEIEELLREYFFDNEEMLNKALKLF
jgi:5-methylcytosine-specific restriction enzyme B